MILLLFAVVGCGAAWAQESNVAWVKVTDYDNLSTSDTYVIAGNGAPNGTTWYSLRNSKVESAENLPSNQLLTISGDRITSTISSEETWLLESAGDNKYYIKSTAGNFYLQNTGIVKSLISTKNSNSTYNQWMIHYTRTNNAGTHTVTGLYNVGSGRMMGLYLTSSIHDWRSYLGDDYKNISGEEVVLYRKVISVPVSISSAKYASFCSVYPLDFSGTGITVYKAKGNTDVVTLTKVEDGIVPANEGVVLYSENATSQNVPVATTDGNTDWSDNELVGITERTLVSITGDNDKTNYILSYESSGIGFYLAADGDGAYLAGNRAYLSTSTTAAPFLSFEEETTGIGLTPSLSQGEGVCYDLSGRRVAQPTKGLYIINGKKVIIK